MQKTLLGILVAALLVAACDNRPRLVIYTWSEMFPQEIISEFEQETGIRVQYVNFDENEVMFARLQAAKGGNYDLIIADDYMLENVFSAGLAQRLDRSRLSNFGNINPLYQGQFYDPNDEFSVPYGAGVQTIVYNPALIDIPIRGYANLWNPALAQRVGIIGNYRVINGMALKVIGESYNTNNLNTIRAAGDLLLSLAPNIRLIRDDRLEDELISGEITAAVMYTSQVTAAKLERPDLRVVYPTEGIGFGIMAAFIPVNAPNPDAAYQFLDFILDAEKGAQCFMELGYYSTFSASDRLIDEEYRDFLTLPEDFGGFDSMEMIMNVNDESRELHNRIWTEFRSAVGQ